MGMGRETLSQAPVKVRGEKKIAASGTLCLAFSDLRSSVLHTFKRKTKRKTERPQPLFFHVYSIQLISTYSTYFVFF